MVGFIVVIEESLVCLLLVGESVKEVVCWN